MKRTKQIIGLAVVFSLLALTPACITRDATGAKVPDIVKNDKLASLISATAAQAVTAIVRNNPGSGVYFDQVAAVFCKMVADNKFAPETLEPALNLIALPQKNQQLIAGAKNFLVLLYNINFANQLSISTDPNRFGGVLARCLCTGITTGLHDAQTAPAMTQVEVEQLMATLREGL